LALVLLGLGACTGKLPETTEMPPEQLPEKPPEKPPEQAPEYDFFVIKPPVIELSENAQEELFFGVMQQERIIVYPSKGEESPDKKISFSLVDVRHAGPLRDLVRQILYNGKTPGEYMQRIKESDCLETYIPYEDTPHSFEELRDSTFMPYTEMAREYIELHKVFLYPHLAVLSKDKFAHTGGIHGNSWKYWYVFDLKDIKMLYLTDIIREGALPAVKVLMREYLWDYEKRDDESVFYPFRDEDLPLDYDVTADFFLSPQGLGFQWDPYEIAAYAIGTIEIIIPYEKLKNLLTPKGIEITGRVGN
jgi:hypothetical protein